MDDSDIIDEQAHLKTQDLDLVSIEKEQLSGSPPLRRKRAVPSEHLGVNSMDPLESDNPVDEEGAPDGFSSGALGEMGESSRQSLGVAKSGRRASSPSPSDSALAGVCSPRPAPITYVVVVEEEGEDPVEVPCEPDGTLLLSTLQAQFPGCVGLRFKSQSGAYRGVRLVELRLLPPEDGWEGMVYICVFPKSSGSDNYKRKGDEGFGLENPSAKTKRLGVEQQQHQQKLAAQAQHHREQQHREREREASGAASSGKGTRWDLNEAAASSGGDKHPVDLIVLGLPADTDEDDLRTHFERYGNIAFIQLKRDRSKGDALKGYAFVRYTEYEAQLAALSATHTIRDTKIYLKIPDSQMVSKEADRMQHKIFVGNVSDKLSSDDLRNYFNRHGTVIDVFLPNPHRGFAFVTFAEAESADKMPGTQHVIKGVSVHCGSATLRQSDRQKLQQQQQPPAYPPAARNTRNPQCVSPLAGSASAPKSGRGGRQQMERQQGAPAHSGPAPLLPAPQPQNWSHASNAPVSQQPPPQPPAPLVNSLPYQQQQQQQQQAAAAAAAAAMMQQQMAAAASMPMQMPGSPMQMPYMHPQMSSMAAMMPAMAAAAAAANPAAGIMPSTPYGAMPQAGMMPVAPAPQHYMMAGAAHPAAPPTSWPMNANTPQQGFDFNMFAPSMFAALASHWMSTQSAAGANAAAASMRPAGIAVSVGMAPAPVPPPVAAAGATHKSPLQQMPASPAPAGPAPMDALPATSQYECKSTVATAGAWDRNKHSAQYNAGGQTPNQNYW